MKKRLLATRVFFLAVTAAVILLAALSFARGEGVRLSAVTAAAVPLAAFFATFIPQIGRKDAKRLEKAAQPYMGRAFDGHGKESRLFLRAFAFWQQGKNGEAEAAYRRALACGHQDNGALRRMLMQAKTDPSPGGAGEC